MDKYPKKISCKAISMDCRVAYYKYGMLCSDMEKEDMLLDRDQAYLTLRLQARNTGIKREMEIEVLKTLEEYQEK